jgi:hypothetical protein
MTALALDRNTSQYGTPDTVQPLLLSFPVAASTKIYGGSILATNSSGRAVPASADNTLKVWGRCEAQADNSSGTAGAINATAKPGVFYFANDATNPVAATDVGKFCYILDDQTVSISDGSGLRPVAGIVYAYDSTSGVAVGLGFTSPYVLNPELAPSGGGGGFKARGAVFANVSDLTAFTVASNDGITYAAGDIVLLTNQTTTAECGPYVVGTVASTTAPLTRPDWWYTGMAIPQGVVIDCGGEGTIFGGSQWKAMCAKSKVVGTHDPVFYPRVCKATVTLSSGTKALGATQGLFLYSTTSSIVQVTRQTAGGTLTNTTHYYAPSASSARVAGKSGTAVVTANASVAAGTVNTADTSDVDVLVTNW